MMASTGSGRVWFHKHLGRMETEKLLMESREDGSFLIRESDTVKGAYVLSTIYQQRIHHYRILPNEEGRLSIQAQQGVQRKQFSHLDEMVDYYSHSRRGLVCALTIPISQKKEEEEEEEEEEEAPDDDDADDSDDGAGEGSRDKNLISKFLLAFLSTMDTSRVDESFLELVRAYLIRDVTGDIESMTTPTPRLSSFKQLFNKDCVILHKQLSKMLAQVDLMRALFETAGGAKHGGANMASSKKNSKPLGTEMDYDSLVYKLKECSDSIIGLETIAFQMLRELCSSMTGGKTTSNSLVQPVANGVVAKLQSLPRSGEDEEEVIFEVKMEQGISGLSTRKNVVISVNLKECRFQFFKHGDSQRSTYEHHQLLQLVKSRSRDTRLSVVFQGQSRKEYVFNDMQSREQFCQLTQLIRNRMLAGEDQDIISVFVGSWNMGDAGPPPDITSWMQSLGMGKTLPVALTQAHDVYAFGTQESSIAERDWVAKIRQTLKTIHDIDYEKVVCHTLWGMRCLVVAKPEHMNKIAHVQTSSVKTGIGNTLGNKGGVGISLFFGSISLCFICTHLTSGNEKCSRRNQNYHDILKGMSNLKQKKLSQFDLTNQFNHLFFFGDLNYRVDLGATEIVEYAKRFEHYSIFQEDQLRKEKEKKAVFVGFDEPPILFPPTYRFQRGSRTLDDYVWVKQKRAGIRINVPSYCDRVMWRSYPGAGISNTSYGCTDDITTSDHSPVFATFQMHGFKQYASDSGKDVKNENAHIVVVHSNAKIATSSKTNFYMEFYSSCFEGTVKTSPNNDWQTVNEANCTWPVWRPPNPLANIKPIVTEEGYLEQQHLLVMLKSQEGDEPYAECCLALRGVIGREPVLVSRELTHQGHSVGELEISIHVTLDTYRERKSEEELYTEVNFITQDEPASSLDKPGATRRSRGMNSDSDISRGGSGSRPRLPVPPGNSQPGNDRHRTTLPGMASTLPGMAPVLPGMAPSLPGMAPSLPGMAPVLPGMAPSLPGMTPSLPGMTPSLPGMTPSLPGMTPVLPGMAPSLPGMTTVQTSNSQPPPPLPRRRDLNTSAPLPVPTSPRPPLTTPSSRPMDIPPPAVPLRRGGETARNPFSRSEPAKPEPIAETHRMQRTTSPGHPIPAKRKVTKQLTTPLPGDQSPAFPPAARSLNASFTAAGPLLPTSSRSRLPGEMLTPTEGPPVPRRQGGVTRLPRPPSSVKSLLEANGLQHFSDVLLSNGYDDLQFLAEVADAELHEIGIRQAADRDKVLKVFRNYAHQNH